MTEKQKSELALEFANLINDFSKSSNLRYHEAAEVILNSTAIFLAFGKVEDASWEDFAHRAGDALEAAILHTVKERTLGRITSNGKAQRLS